MFEITTNILLLVSVFYNTSVAPIEMNIAPKTLETPVYSSESLVLASFEKAPERYYIDRDKVESKVRRAFSDQPILIEIAKCESEFRHYGKSGTPIRGLVNPSDVGVMQINEYYHGKTAKNLGLDIHTLEGNLDYAVYLYDKYGVSPWKHSSKCWDKDSKKA